MPEKVTLALVSLGCPKNLVDSQAMLGLADRAGYEIVEQVQDADIVVVNTCAFIEPAQEEAIDALLDLADLKQQRCKALICTGCLVQRHGRELMEQLPEVDGFVGVGAVPRIMEAVEAVLAGQRVFLDSPLTYVYDGTGPRLHTGAAWLSYLKVADGCDHRCAFCTIPDIRGRYRSVPPALVASQLEQMAADAVSEVCLIAQDTTAYGRDLVPPLRLMDLLDELGRVDFSGWLRLLYLYPHLLDDELIHRMCSAPPLVPYFDLPLQHAAGSVLRRMGRPGDADTYLGLLQRIRSAGFDPAIRTTFIVGFPGETDEEFEELLQFVKAASFDRLSCFRYWPEAGTRAAEMDDQVPMELADERVDELMQLQEDLSLQSNQRFVGRELDVLLEAPIAGTSLWRGRTYRDAPEIDAEVKVQLPEQTVAVVPGNLARVRIEFAEVYDLQGRMLVVSPNEGSGP